MANDCLADAKYFYLAGLMKILIATGIFPPDIGGPATYAKYLSDEFSGRGLEVKVLTYADSARSEAPVNVQRISRGLPRGMRHLVYFLKVSKFSRDSDIVLVTDTVSAGFPVYLASFISRRPYVLKIGGDYVWEQAVVRWGVKDLLDEFLKKRYGVRIEFLRFLQSRVARRAKRVIAPSRYLAAVVASWGVRPKNISVIYNTVERSKVLVSREEARAKLKIGSTDVILFSAGRQVPWKGFEMLREIMPDIQKEFPNARLISGTFAREEYAIWLQAADVFLLNTGYEGFSHQILEAMALGLPIITTNAGGNKEIVEHEKNALVVAYNDKTCWAEAIVRVLRDRELRARLSRGATSRAQGFLEKNMVSETLEVLKNACRT